MTLIQDRAPSTGWSAGIDESVVCTRIDVVTHDVKSFTLTRAGGARLAFDPGQHLTVTVAVGGVAMQRCYTISSSPTRPDELTITVKRVPGGPVSSWLHDRTTVGDTLHVAGPYGRFRLSEHPSPSHLFLSAGSGITPVMSMMRALRDVGDPADVVFVHSARTPGDIIFRDELDEIAVRAGFSVSTVCEGDSADEDWPGLTGRLSLRTLLGLAPDLHDREVFTCGPPGYMQSVEEMLTLAGVDRARCHRESFVLGAGDPESTNGTGTDEGTDVGTCHVVEFRRSDRTFECGPQESILSAALRAGLRPPSMCAEGVCGTCKTGLLSGDVDMRHGGGIRQREIDSGQILICCSTPRGDVAVDA